MSSTNEYLQIKTLNKDQINIIERKFAKVRANYLSNSFHFLNIDQYLREITDLFDKILRLELDDANENIEIKANIGPLSTLPYMIDCSVIPSKRNNFEKIIFDHLNILDKYIYRWRRVAGEGNCFYRAVMFSYLENIILTRNTLLLQKMIIEIDEIFSETNKKINELSNVRKTAFLGINKVLIVKILILIYELLINSKNITSIYSDEDSKLNCYQILLNSIVFCKSFDLVILLFIKGNHYVF